MKVWMVYDKATGRLESVAHDEDGKVEKKQVVADPLPDTMGVKELNSMPNFETHEWDPRTLRMKLKPPHIPTRREVLANMNPADMTELEKIEVMQFAIGRADTVQ